MKNINVKENVVKSSKSGFLVQEFSLHWLATMGCTCTTIGVIVCDMNIREAMVTSCKKLYFTGCTAVCSTVKAN